MPMPAVKPVTAGKKTAKTYQKPCGAVRRVTPNSGVRVPPASAPIARATSESADRDHDRDLQLEGELGALARDER